MAKATLIFFPQFFVVARISFFAVAVSLFFLSQKKGGIDVTFNQYPFLRLSDCNSFQITGVFKVAKSEDLPIIFFPLRNANSILKVCKILVMLLQRQVSLKFCLIYVATINSGENLTWPTLGKQTSVKLSRLESASLLELNTKGKQSFDLLTRTRYSKWYIRRTYCW